MRRIGGTIALLLLVSLVLIGIPSSPEDSFQVWMRNHNKHYSQSQITYRRNIYALSLRQIQHHNELAAAGRYSYTLEANKFTDITDHEYRSLYSRPMVRKQSLADKCKQTVETTPNPPESFDWTKKGTLDVQNQGSCGASWAFAAVGALEGLYAQTKMKLVKLSEQHLLDCSDEYGNEGCSGGLMDQAFWYVIDNGIANNDTYPYTGQDQKCGYKTTMKYAQIKDCADVASGNFMNLISAVIQQPVAVAVESSKFKLYKEGVFDGDCTEDIDAGILLVGYGSTDEGKAYWKLKNSLGTDWGMNGMMLLSMGTRADGPGTCGIQLLGTVPRDLY